MSFNLKTPYFDRKKTYDATERFANDPMQKILALFISRPENYSDLASYGIEDKEDRFFTLFRGFSNNYIDLKLEKNFDTICYFRSLSVDRPGAANLCGGAGKMTGSAKKYFKDRCKRGQEDTKIMTTYLADKYKVLPHARTFLGHTEIWKNPGPHLLELQGWQWVQNQSYDDATFQQPFPEKLDSDLVPLDIRNKTVQKWKNARRAKVSTPSTVASSDEDEESEKEQIIHIPKLIITPELEALFDQDW